MKFSLTILAITKEKHTSWWDAFLSSVIASSIWYNADKMLTFQIIQWRIQDPRDALPVWWPGRLASAQAPRLVWTAARARYFPKKRTREPVGRLVTGLRCTAKSTANRNHCQFGVAFRIPKLRECCSYARCGALGYFHIHKVEGMVTSNSVKKRSCSKPEFNKHTNILMQARHNLRCFSV